MSQACVGKHKEELNGSANGHVSLVGSGNIFTAISNFVIAGAEELEDAHAVSERIGGLRDAIPVMHANLALHGGAYIDLPSDGGAKMKDNKIMVNRRPVSPIAAQVICLCRWPRSVRLQQQIDGRRGPKRFHANEPTCRPTCKP
jgi:hypothetical protein